MVANGKATFVTKSEGKRGETGENGGKRGAGHELGGGWVVGGAGGTEELCAWFCIILCI